jgi:hypothetical protein
MSEEILANLRLAFPDASEDDLKVLQRLTENKLKQVPTSLSDPQSMEPIVLEIKFGISDSLEESLRYLATAVTKLLLKRTEAIDTEIDLGRKSWNFQKQQVLAKEAAAKKQRKAAEKAMAEARKKSTSTKTSNPKGTT